MRRFAVSAVLGLALFISPGVARGSLILFDNRADFDAATSGRTVIDFEGIAPDGDAVGVPVPPGITLAGVTFTTSPPPPGLSSGFVVDGKGFPFPGTSVLLEQQAVLDPDISAALPGPHFAFGVDFAAALAGTEVTFTLSTGDAFLRTASTDLTFVGLFSTDPFTSVTMSIPPPLHDSAGLFVDNFTFGNGASAVPEPSSWILAVIGPGTLFVCWLCPPPRSRSNRLA
jgi:hypothetical protein